MTEWRKNTLNKKPDITLEELEQRKKKLEAELDQIQNHLDDSVIQTRESILSALNPAKKVRLHPYRSVGAALLAGFVAGILKRKKKKHEKKEHEPVHKAGMTHYMFDEMKHIVARRAARYFMDIVDANIKAGLHKPGADTGESQ